LRRAAVPCPQHGLASKSEGAWLIRACCPSCAGCASFDRALAFENAMASTCCWRGRLKAAVWPVSGFLALRCAVICA